MKRRFLSVMLLLCVGAFPGSAAVIRTVGVDDEATSRPAAATTRPTGTNKLSIRVLGTTWGAASSVDIHKVLESAGGELWKHFPDRRLNPIIIQRGRRAPITLYRRGPKGEYLMKLTPDGRYWCQFAYQFAHEFCHILANYSHKTARANKWFEESICEMASIYALRRMAVSWKTKAPYDRWKDYAEDIQAYADDLQKAEDKLPEDKTLAAWYKENSASLRKTPWLRDKNRIVANGLLGLFEAGPGGWAAIEYLNSGKSKSDSFQDYLSNWYRKTPSARRKIVGDIIKLFGLEIPKIKAEKLTSSGVAPVR